MKVKILKEVFGKKVGDIVDVKFNGDEQEYINNGFVEIIKEKVISIKKKSSNKKSVNKKQNKKQENGTTFIYDCKSCGAIIKTQKQIFECPSCEKYKLAKENVKENLFELLNCDEIDKEEGLEKLSKESDIKITILRKQLTTLSKAGKVLQKNEAEEKSKYTENQINEAMKIFDKDDIMTYIKNEISKDHLGDDNLKMTLFLVAVSGLSFNQKRRVSAAIIANSSDGKDNAMKSVLKHIPIEKHLFVTSATQASIEDDIHNTPILVFSELNSNRENGANKNLVEVIKQRTEGGTSAIKKDLRDGMKSTRHEKAEQGTVIFSTTESHMDDEMRTRFLNLNIKSTKEKIHAVNNNTLESFSNIDKILIESDEKDSDIRVGLTGFCQVYDGFHIHLPYVKYLKDFSFIDDADPRSKRDLKRVLSLTCAMTFLNSRRRKRCQKKGVNFLESVPKDLIDTLEISKEFFNQSYTGIDSRLSSIVEFIRKNDNVWVERGEIQKGVDIKSLNTIKEYLADIAMSGRGLIEGKRGSQLNAEIPMGGYHAAKIYYKTCQKGVKKSFLTCQLSELKEYLDKRIKEEEEVLHIKEENMSKNI